MKRTILCVILSTSLILSLCGCMDYRESDSRLVSTAIGFDGDENGVKISVQTVMIAQSGSEKQAYPKVFSASADNVKNAVYDLYSKLPKPLLFDHCGVLVIGSDLNEEIINQIFKFCSDEKSLNLAIRFICSDNAFELLSRPAMSAVANGYDIMEMLESESNQTGTLFSNRFYEIEAAKQKIIPVYTIPDIVYDKDDFYIDGQNVFIGSSPKIKLNNRQAVIYSIICNDFSSGNVRINDQYARLISSHTRFSSSITKGGLKIKLKGDIISENESKYFKSALANEVDSLISTVRKNNLGDIFGFADRIYYRSEKEWESLKKDYQNRFSSKQTIIEYEA